MMKLTGNEIWVWHGNPNQETLQDKDSFRNQCATDIHVCQASLRNRRM